MEICEFELCKLNDILNKAMAQYSPEFIQMRFPGNPFMNTDRVGLKKMTRGELKDMAVSYGLYNGYHERPISKMRKTDYIDYILESLTTPVGSPSEPNIPSAPIQPPPRPSRPRGTRPPRNSARNSANAVSGGDLLIRLIPPFNLSESPTGSSETSARRRLDFEEDFGSLLNFAIILHDATTRNLPEEPEGREFTGQFPTVEEEPEQAHESVRCAVCLHNKICVLFQKCKHVVTCGPCGLKMSKCPVCKNPIEHEEKIRVFLP